MPTRQFTLDWSMRMSRRAIQHTSASSHHSLASPFVVAHVKADTDTMMMTNGKDEPNEPFKLIYLADSANDNLKNRANRRERERQAGTIVKQHKRKKMRCQNFCFTLLFSGLAASSRSEKALQSRRVASMSRSSCSSPSIKAEMSLTPLAISGKLDEMVDMAAPTAWWSTSSGGPASGTKGEN